MKAWPNCTIGHSFFVVGPAPTSHANFERAGLTSKYNSPHGVRFGHLAIRFFPLPRSRSDPLLSPNDYQWTPDSFAVVLFSRHQHSGFGHSSLTSSLCARWMAFNGA